MGSLGMNNKYSIPNDKIKVAQWNSAWPTYSSRGTQITYSYDVAVDSDCITQGQVGNGAMEIWDYDPTDLLYAKIFSRKGLSRS